MKYLITAALPYANGPLHFGHMAGCYLPADIFAKFKRFAGDDVLFLCGSDEYGVAVTLSAEQAGRTPKEHVDHFHQVNQELFEQMHIHFDHYSRTTTPFHQKPVQEFFLDLYENGFIEERVSEQLFSEKENRFLADRYVLGECPKCHFPDARGDECTKCGANYEAIDLINPRSKLSGASLVKKATNHWFLKFDLFKKQLKEWLEEKDWKPNVKNFVREYIDELRARAITRDSDWGIPVPLEGAEGKVLYVWFDAPIGYISAAMEWADRAGDPDLWKRYWMEKDTHLTHFIGKDNIPFHAIFFPAMTMGQNKSYKLVDSLPANEFLNLEGKQFSKSGGWYIDLKEFLQEFSVDMIRYYLAANAPETQDSEFSWDDFKQRCNADLVGKLGNFANRVLVFTRNNCEEMIPELGSLERLDQDFLSEIDALVSDIEHAYSHYQVRRATQLIMELAQKGNIYFDHKKPWKDAKETESFPRMKTTIACCFYAMKALIASAYPIIPNAMQTLWKLLGQKQALMHLRFSDILEMSFPPKTKIAEPKILFAKLEEAQIDKWKAKLGKQETPVNANQPVVKNPIEFTEFQNIDLRVAKVLSAEPVPKSSKLLKLQVDLGFEKRTIVSGIAKHVSPEELQGKNVAIVANLKPVKLMGIESQGMLLSAEFDKTLAPLTLADLPPGSPIA